MLQPKVQPHTPKSAHHGLKGFLLTASWKQFKAWNRVAEYPRNDVLDNMMRLGHDLRVRFAGNENWNDLKRNHPLWFPFRESPGSFPNSLRMNRHRNVVKRNGTEHF